MLTYQNKIYGNQYSTLNTIRNQYYFDQKKPKYTKTGTTIVGVTFKDGVVLAADTRATVSYVVDKKCNKIHYIAPNVRVCGAGTAADCEHVTRKLRAQMDLMRRNTGRETLVSTVVCRAQNELFRYGGYIGAYMIFAGFDVNGPHLVQVSATAFAQYSPFMAMGSGSINAYAELESGFKDNMTKEEAI